MAQSLFKFLMTCWYACFIITSYGQTSQHAVTTLKQHQLPGLTDWFLSTGNWQTDPQLYVYEFGEGKDTVVMLHGGWGGDFSGLVDPVKNLRHQYHFVFYDQRGSLRSPFPDSLISFEHHIHDLELLRKELRLQKLNVVGHSMGAILASAYAMKFPDRIQQLTLIAPPMLKEPLPQQDKALQHQGYLASQAFLNRPEVKQELDKYALNRSFPPLTSVEETSKFRIIFGARMLYDISNWQKLTGGRALYKGKVYELTSKTYPASGWNFIDEFKGKSYRVNIIAGDHDFLDFGNNVLKTWISGIPNISITTINKAGHIPWLDQPGEFSSVLAKYLKP